MKLFDIKNIQFLKKSLDVYTKTHEAIADNIANANRKDYQRKNTDFSDLLQSNMERTLKVTRQGHIGETTQPQGSKANFSEKGEDGVDISQDMGSLAENQIRYDFAARALTRAYKSLNLSITGKNG